MRKNGLTVSEKVKVDLVERDGNYMLETNLYEVLGGFSSRMINTEVLGKAFEPEEPFENPDGTPIQLTWIISVVIVEPVSCPVPSRQKKTQRKNYIEFTGCLAALGSPFYISR